MSDYIAPLNLQYIFQNVLAGSPDIFLALFLIGFSVVAGMFKMTGYIYGVMLVLASMLLYAWLGGGLYILLIFVLSMIIFMVISKIVKD